MNDNAEAQWSINRLESIANETNVLTSAQVNVGDGPFSIAAQPFRDNIYVANSGSDTVSVIDPATHAVIKNINVGDSPSVIGTPHFGNNIYVANSDSGTVSVIDSTTNTVIKNITVGFEPSFIDTFEDPIYGNNIYVANSGSGTVSVINSTTNDVIKNITVGFEPSFIDTYGQTIYVSNSFDPVSVINSTTNDVIKNITVGDGSTFIDTYGQTIYVSNSGSGTVSVINSTTNDVIKNIKVGDNPLDINTYGQTIYVSNFGSGTVSVINSTTNDVIKNITVGDDPGFIYVYEDTIYGHTIYGNTTYSDPIYGNNIYVANYGSDTVSVIDPAINTVIKNITVGDGPSFIDNYGESIYVSNSHSDTVSVIDSVTNEVVAGVTFEINPFGGGQIICNGLDVPTNRYFYVSSGTGCVAKPNNGYEFASWVEMFDDNSTRTISASTTSDWLVDPVSALHDVFTDDPAATLTVNRFGNFTAYFRALPPPVPAEFTASLITVVFAALVGSLLIPAVVSWIKSKKQTSRLNSFHQQMALVYADGKLDENDINQLNSLNKNISDSYAAGKITNDQYTNLKNEVSAAYQKIFKKRIESITDTNMEVVNNIKNDIEDAYSDRKITELDYNLLNGKILRMLDNK